MRQRRVRFLSAVLLLLAGASAAVACSVPVFRYALEQWHPDRYLVFLFHKGELTPEQQAMAKQFEFPPGSSAAPANVEFFAIDLNANPDPELLAIWEKNQSEQLPRLVVQTPLSFGQRATVWAGELLPDNVARLLDSPARQELARRLLSGDSVVWVFLESGDKAQDDKAFAVLSTELASLQQTLKLPDVAPEDVASLSIAPEALQLRLSTLRLSRDDPAESRFVDILMHTEPDLLNEEYAGKPITFPIFGRGRALYALLGGGITAETIQDACHFLTGACQCTVKAENPGFDLIVAADWEKQIVPIAKTDTPPVLSGLGGFRPPETRPAKPDSAWIAATPETDAAAQPAAEPRAATASAPAAATSRADEAAEPSSFLPNVLLAVVGLLFVVVVAAVIFVPRQGT